MITINYDTLTLEQLEEYVEFIELIYVPEKLVTIEFLKKFNGLSNVTQYQLYQKTYEGSFYLIIDAIKESIEWNYDTVYIRHCFIEGELFISREEDNVFPCYEILQFNNEFETSGMSKESYVIDSIKNIDKDILKLKIIELTNMILGKV